jgi:hypothetical protein
MGEMYFDDVMPSWSATGITADDLYGDKVRALGPLLWLAPLVPVPDDDDLCGRVVAILSPPPLFF